MTLSASGDRTVKMHLDLTWQDVNMLVAIHMIGHVSNQFTETVYLGLELRLHL